MAYGGLGAPKACPHVWRRRERRGCPQAGAKMNDDPKGSLYEVAEADAGLALLAGYGNVRISVARERWLFLEMLGVPTEILFLQINCQVNTAENNDIAENESAEDVKKACS